MLFLSILLLLQSLPFVTCDCGAAPRAAEPDSIRLEPNSTFYLNAPFDIAFHDHFRVQNAGNETIFVDYHVESSNRRLKIDIPVWPILEPNESIDIPIGFDFLEISDVTEKSIIALTYWTISQQAADEISDLKHECPQFFEQKNGTKSIEIRYNI